MSKRYAMMNARTFHRMWFQLLLVAVLSLCLQSCFTTGGGGPVPPPPADDSPPAASRTPQAETNRTAEEVDSDISRLKKKIEDMSEFETQQRQIAVINQIQDQKSRGWTKGDGKPSYEDLADQANQQAAAAEKEVQKLKRDLAKAEKEKQVILSQSNGCFPAETLVFMEDGTCKPFAQIVSGDRVLTYDIGYDRLVGRPVIALYTVEANHLYTLNDEFTTTGGERLLTPSGWEKVRNLQPGDRVHVNGRMIEIKHIDYRREERRLNNMQVSDTHNFYVATPDGTRYLVHNCGGGGK